SATSGSPIGRPPNGEPPPSASTPRSFSAPLPMTTTIGGEGTRSTSERRLTHCPRITERPCAYGSIAVCAAQIRIGDIAFLATVLGLDITRCRRFITPQSATVGVDHGSPV